MSVLAALVVGQSAANAATGTTDLIGNTSYSGISNTGSSSCAAGSYAYGARIWYRYGGASLTTGVAALCRDSSGGLSQASSTGYTFGSSSDSTCHGSDPAVGIYGRSGEIVDALGVVCFDATTGTTYDAALVGDTGGSAVADTNCPAGSALTGFTDWFGSWNNLPYQYGVQGSCDVYRVFSGVLQPINADGSSIFKAGSTVPVKFMVTGLGGTSLSDVTATLSFSKISDGVEGSYVEATTNVAATTGNLFRYDATSGQYIFNWSTKGLTAGTYRLAIHLGYGPTFTVDVSLK